MKIKVPNEVTKNDKWKLVSSYEVTVTTDFVNSKQ